MCLPLLWSAQIAVEETFWAEMNRREVWDRAFEKRMSNFKAASQGVLKATDELKAERAGEDDRRGNGTWSTQPSRRCKVSAPPQPPLRGNTRK
jgi:hypothetical protein